MKKGVIDTSVLDKWPTITSSNISVSGEFVNYKIDNYPVGSSTIVFASTNSQWKREYNAASKQSFSTNNKFACLLKHDSLCLITLGTNKEEWIANVQGYNFTVANDSDLLVYFSKSKILFIRDLNTGIEKRIENIYSWQLSENKKYLLWQSIDKDRNIYQLKFLELGDGTEYLVNEASNSPVENIVVNKDNSAILFTNSNGSENAKVYKLNRYERRNHKTQIIYEGRSKPTDLNFCKQTDKELIFHNDHVVFYYRDGMKKAIEKMSDFSSSVPKGFVINFNSPLVFSDDGRRIIFCIKEMSDSISNKTTRSGVDVWNYRDRELQSVQSHSIGESTNSFGCVLDLESNKLTRIEYEGESFSAVWNLPYSKQFTLATKNLYHNELWHNPQDVRLVSLDGKFSHSFIKELKMGADITSFELSPSENFVIYYLPKAHSFFSYNNTSGSTIAINNLKNKAHPKLSGNSQIIGWIDGGHWFLAYDKYYDIWMIDPSGKNYPVCMTSKFARKNDVKFDLAYRQTGERIAANYSRDLFSEEKLLVQGLNLDNKEVGFYKLTIGRPEKPELIFKGKFDCNSELSLQKAKQANKWLLTRSSSTEARNLFFSEDLKFFKRVTNNQPQKEFIWYTSKLIKWKLPNGTHYKGALFKPENFDSTQKYPVIINYYNGDWAGGVFRYRAPSWTNDCNINIPYWCSRGYLVFQVYIPTHEVGYPGKNALEIVNSAVIHLAKNKNIDKTKIGICGHSFGGFETNYIITHSHLFAAAAEGAGVSDFVSNYNSILLNGITPQDLYEYGQSNVGNTLWGRPDLYLNNSAIFQADKVTTPLLILHNKEDASVNFQQGVEMFVALRRLNKKVWMLQYDGEDHGLRKHENVVDYTIRLTQFFDHYLKDSLAPVWMTQGIPAMYKGKKTGYELDISGIQP